MYDIDGDEKITSIDYIKLEGAILSESCLGRELRLLYSQIMKF